MKTEKGIITTDIWDIPYLSTMHKDNKKEIRTKSWMQRIL